VTRLFPLLKNTAFAIAADSDMIKHAVRRHVEGANDDLPVTNYFDKLSRRRSCGGRRG
jgi:predicted KAP-like P-loop ATPase